MAPAAVPATIKPKAALDALAQAAQPLRGSFRLRRRSLAGDEAAAAELLASISALTKSNADNAAAASDPEHLREAKDQHDGSYLFNYRETQAGYYRAIVLCGGRSIKHFIVLIDPGRLDPEKCFVGGPCFETSEPGHHVLQVELYDKYGNAAPWPTNPGVKVVVTWQESPNVNAVAGMVGGAKAIPEEGKPEGRVSFSGEEEPPAAEASKPKVAWKRAAKTIPIADFELTEPPEGGSLRLPMTRSGRYLITVTYQGMPLGGVGNRETSVTASLNAKPVRPFRDTFISGTSDQDAEGAHAGSESTALDATVHSVLSASQAKQA